eukprot:8442742-Pyramimonas_sp.AAC.1
MHAWASRTAGAPAVGSGFEASLTSNGASSHWGLAVIVKDIDPRSSVPFSHSSALSARCPEGVFIKS